ncbi:MAG: hypothetical protein LC679_17575, partial [Intrasporangiaceae bacterium]|nr:hypothetical protein [Intrasporangiaceae bacterium]
LAVVAASVVLVTVPLTLGTREVVLEQLTVGQVRPVAEAWAEAQDWEVAEISLRGDVIHVISVGPDPAPDPAALRAELDAAGVRDLTLDVTLLEGVSETLPATR